MNGDQLKFLLEVDDRIDRLERKVETLSDDFEKRVRLLEDNMRWNGRIG